MQLGFVAQLCLAAVDVEQGLQLACHFSPLWSRRRFHYERAGDDVHVCARELQTDAEPGTFDAFDTAVIWSRMVEKLSDGAVLPRALDAPTHHTERLREFFGCPIRHSANELTVRFLKADVQHKNPRFDPSLVRLLATHGEQRLTDLARGDSARTQARHALARISTGGSALRVEALARELGLGVRTLHRRLRAEGTSFRELLSDHQRERSVVQLESHGVSAKQVAFELGFSDPASFHRAFKRWTGRTVSQYRGINNQTQGQRAR